MITEIPSPESTYLFKMVFSNISIEIIQNIKEKGNNLLQLHIPFSTVQCKNVISL